MAVFGWVMVEFELVVVLGQERVKNQGGGVKKNQNPLPAEGGGLKQGSFKQLTF